MSKPQAPSLRADNLLSAPELDLLLAFLKSSMRPAHQAQRVEQHLLTSLTFALKQSTRES